MDHDNLEKQPLKDEIVYIKKKFESTRKKCNLDNKNWVMIKLKKKIEQKKDIDHH
jgi:hypothetical protein